MEVQVKTTPSPKLLLVTARMFCHSNRKQRPAVYRKTEESVIGFRSFLMIFSALESVEACVLLIPSHNDLPDTQEDSRSDIKAGNG